MSLTYAGSPIGTITDELQAKINFLIPIENTFYFDRLAWPGWNRAHWNFPNNIPHHKTIRINALEWPVGASRFAYGHFLLEGNDLKPVREQAVNGGQLRTLPLVYDDGIAQPTTIYLYMLPAWPLAQCTDPVLAETENLYLVTLVDQRFWFWMKSCEILVVEGTTTWADLFADIGDCWGTTIDITTAIEAAYLSPPLHFTSRYTYAPLMADAAAFSVGRRLVFNTDGTVILQTPREAFISLSQQLPNTVKYAGGKLALTP